MQHYYEAVICLLLGLAVLVTFVTLYRTPCSEQRLEDCKLDEQADSAEPAAPAPSGADPSSPGRSRV